MVILLIITRTPHNIIKCHSIGFPFNLHTSTESCSIMWISSGFSVSHLNLFTAIYRQKIAFFFFFSHTVYSPWHLSFSVPAQSNYRLFQLAFRELNKQAVQRVLSQTGTNRCTITPPLPAVSQMSHQSRDLPAAPVRNYHS